MFDIFKMHQYFQTLTTLIFIALAIAARVQLHISEQEQNNFILNNGHATDRAHWTSPVVIKDNLSTTSTMCQFQCTFMNMYVHTSIYSPNLSCVLRNLNKKSHAKLALLLILAGDISTNPGPKHNTKKPKHPCVHCGKGVIARSRAISCDGCGRWIHSRCTKILTNAEYDNMVAENTEIDYMCNFCSLDELPFANCEDEASESSPNNGNSSNSNQTDNDFDSFYDCFKQKGLHFIHLNIRSLISKVSELRILANNCSASIIAISETWLDSSISDSEISINGYTVIRSDRNREGGGVCLYIKDNLAFNYRSDLSNDNVESLWVDILLPKTKPIVVGVCYRPPKDKSFLDHFELIFSKIRSDCEVVVLGDFNINSLAPKTSGLLKKYLDLLGLFSLKNLITEPTRITSTSSSSIDHIICNSNKICQSGVINIGLSDHLLIYCTRKVVRGQMKQHNNVRIRSMKNYSADALSAAISAADWSGVYCSDVNTSWNVFKKVLNNIIETLAPIKEIRLKNRTEPWISNEILDAIKLRDNLLYRYKKDQKPELYSEFCKIRNKIQRDIKRAKSTFFQNKIEEFKFNPKKLWENLKTLGYSNKSKDKSRIILNIDGELCFDTNRVANYINQFYTTIASKLVNKLPSSLGNFCVDSSTFTSYYNNLGVTPNSFKLCRVSSDFILKELRSLNPNKSTGLDGVPARFLRDGADLLKDQLTHIINVSITTSTVPTEFKLARVRPLYKKNSRSEVGNYRPVSILCVASKILEKAVYSQLETYLRENNILYGFQSGFRSRFSTDSCLIHLNDYIRSQMSKGNYTGLVLIDLQKAFDTVDHVILCKKLRTMGIASVDWFSSYLSDRKQIVNVNDVDSNPLGVSCGVPQGSILGPLLFLCYVNDMASSVRCKLLLYADDSALLVSGKDPGHIAESLSKELDSCRQWLIDNKLSLHLGKTECMLFGTQKRLNKVNSFSVSCDGQSIKSTKVAKYLGVTLDETLKGESIAKDIIKKAGARLRFLYRQAGNLNLSTRKTLCNALIMCHYDYSCSSWYSSLSQHFKNRLQTMQNKIVRFILNLGPRTHIGQKERSKVGMLSVHDRVVQLKLNQIFKVFHELAPDYLRENFIRINQLHTYSTRDSPYNFVVPRSHSNISCSFFYTGIRHWNSLPHSIKQITNFSQFKKAVKKHLMDQASLNEQSPFIR